MNGKGEKLLVSILAITRWFVPRKAARCHNLSKLQNDDEGITEKTWFSNVKEKWHVTVLEHRRMIVIPARIF